MKNTGEVKPNKEKNVRKAIFFMLAAGLGFSLMSVMVKLAGDLPVFQKAFFRNFFAAAVAFGIILKSRGLRSLHIEKKSYFPLFMRSAAGTVGVVCNFWAVDHILLADANVLNKTSPFFSVIFAAILIGEIPNSKNIFYLVMAAIGVIFVIKPGTTLFSAGSIIALIGGVCAGLAYTYVRVLGIQKVRKEVIVFVFSTFSSLACVPFMILDFKAMTLMQFIIMVLAGVFASVGQLGVTNAYYYASPKEISVFDYMQVLYSAIFAAIIWHEIPDWMSFIGYAIIILAAILRWRNMAKEI